MLTCAVNTNPCGKPATHFALGWGEEGCAPIAAPARKRTWLYIVGVRMGELVGPLAPQPHRIPTHWCSGVQTPGKRGKPPAGKRIASAQQRRRTPPMFAEWLVSIARRVDARKAA